MKMLRVIDPSKYRDITFKPIKVDEPDQLVKELHYFEEQAVGEYYVHSIYLWSPVIIIIIVGRLFIYVLVLFHFVMKISKSYKFGILYAAKGQMREEDMFANGTYALSLPSVHCSFSKEKESNLL